MKASWFHRYPIHPVCSGCLSLMCTYFAWTRGEWSWVGLSAMWIVFGCAELEEYFKRRIS